MSLNTLSPHFGCMYRLYTLFEGLRLRGECPRDYMSCRFESGPAARPVAQLVRAMRLSNTLSPLSRCPLVGVRCPWPFEGDNGTDDDQRTTNNDQRTRNNENAA